VGQSLTSAYSQWPVPAPSMSSFSSCFNQVPTKGARAAGCAVVVVAISDVVVTDAEVVGADADVVLADAEDVDGALEVDVVREFATLVDVVLGPRARMRRGALWRRHNRSLTEIHLGSPRAP
jgi:hypothetical protein